MKNYIYTIIKCFIPMLTLMGIQFICAVFTSILNIPYDTNLLMKQMFMYNLIGLSLFGYIYISKNKDKKSNTCLTKWSLPIIILLFTGLGTCLSGLLTILSIAMPYQMESYVTHTNDIGITNIKLLGMAVILILTPILEEIVYRGLVLKLANENLNSFIFANIIQAIIFGISHFNLIQGIYAFMVGLVLGYIYKRYNTIFAPIIGHITFNFIGTIGVTIIFESVTAMWQLIFITCIALIITIFLFMQIKHDTHLSE